MYEPADLLLLPSPSPPPHTCSHLILPPPPPLHTVPCLPAQVIDEDGVDRTPKPLLSLRPMKGGGAAEDTGTPNSEVGSQGLGGYS